MHKGVKRETRLVVVVVAEILEATIGEGETVLVLGPEEGVESGLVEVCGVAEEVPRVVAGVEEVLVGGLVIERSRFPFGGGG